MVIILQKLIKNLRLIQLFGLLVILNIASCKCGNKGTEKNLGAINVEVSPLQLDPDNLTTTITLQLLKPGTQVDLTNFKLKANIIKQEGSVGSKISYQDAVGSIQELEEIDCPLAHFTSVTTLDDSNSPLTIEFNLLVDNAITFLNYQIEIFDTQENLINNYLVEYKNKVDLPAISLVGANKLEGDQKEIHLNIHNISNDPIVANQLKLLITRTEGAHASIVGANLINNPNTYEVVISDVILAKGILNKTLFINPQNDKKANFDIQLVRGKVQTDPIKVEWEQGMHLELAVKCEESSHQLTYNIVNSGTKEIKNARLEYSCKTAGVQLAGVALVMDNINEVILGDIQTNQKLDNQGLGEIDFGTNDVANFTFKLIYEGGSIETNQYFLAADVNLNIDVLNYDIDSKEVSLSIFNSGKDIAEDVEVRYINESADVIGGEALIDNKKTASMPKINIPGTTKTSLPALSVDLKQADEATFKFEVLYKGRVINQATRSLKCKAKEVDLKLVSFIEESNILMLLGNIQSLSFKIELERNSRPFKEIDLKDLQLDITNTSGNSSFITMAPGDNIAIKSLKLSELGIDKITSLITLYIHPNTKKEAKFEIKLSYKGQLQGKPLTINWEEQDIKIRGLEPLIGDNETSFKLYSNNSIISPASLNIELSSKDATFTFLKDRDLGSSAILAQLLGRKSIQKQKETAPIRFRLLDAKGKDRARVTVTVKRGSTILASQTVDWTASKTNIEVTSPNQTQFFENQDIYTIALNNKGDKIDTSKIQFKLINNNSVPFKVGGLLLDTTIDTDLKSIIKKDYLEKGESITFDIQHDGESIYDLYNTHIMLELLNRTTGASLFKRELTWIDQLKIDTSLKRLQPSWEELNKNFEEHTGENLPIVKQPVDFEQIIENLNKIKLEKGRLSLFFYLISSYADEKYKQQIQKEFIDPVPASVEIIKQKISQHLTYMKEQVKYYDEEIRKNIKELEDNTAKKTQVTALIDDQLLQMNKWITSINNINKIWPDTKEILQEVEEIAKQTQEAVNKVKELLADKSA